MKRCKPRQRGRVCIISDRSRYKFRLAVLLRLRETTRDQCRLRLAEARRTDEELRQQLIRLDVERKQLQSECRQAAGPGAVDVDQLVEAHRYASSLRAREAELCRQRQTLALEIDRRRQTLLAADRDVRVLEKLRERRLQQHRREEQRREAKQLC